MRTLVFTAVSATLLVVAMVFLILATVTSPVATALKLGETSSYTYGLFGYCKGTSCLLALYPVGFGDVDDASSWLLGSSLRNTLAKTFIVVPIAAGLTLFALVSTTASIFLDTSTLKIFSLVFAVVSFVATTLVAVMVVLVFHPHVAWGGWLVVAAAACCLLAVPLLFLSIGVHNADDADSEAASESGQKLGAYGELEKDTSYTGGTFAGGNSKYQFYGPTSNTTDDVSSVSKDYSYRGAKPTGYSAQKNASQTSLLDSKPKLTNDLTRPNTNPTNLSGGSNSSYYEDAAVNINNGPSTPVSSKQKMAPNFVPNVAVPSGAGRLPYPQSERGSMGYNAGSYGVFEHHPDVEGHQPFTELGDNDLPERTSMRELDSDDDSDFTSVSQRPPNVLYQNAAQGQQQFRQPQLQYQQQYPNVSQFQPPFQQQQQQPQPGFYNAPNAAAGSPGMQNFQQAPPTSFLPQYQLQYQPQYQPQQAAPAAARPANRGPTISDNVLNNNPDFAIGFAGRRKQFGAGVPPANRFGAAARPGAQRPRTQARDGPYNML